MSTYVGVNIYFNLVCLAAYLTLFFTLLFLYDGIFWIYLQRLYIKLLILYNVYMDTSLFPLLTFRLFPFFLLLQKMLNILKYICLYKHIGYFAYYNYKCIINC